MIRAIVMLPFNVILIGIRDDLLGQLRKELATANATVETECHDVRSGLPNLRASRAQIRLIIVYVAGAEQVNEVRKLSSLLPGWPILALVELTEDADNLLRANRAGAAQLVILP